MKLRKELVIFNCFVHLLLYSNVFVWIFSSKGNTYLSNLSSQSIYIFYAILILSIIYSGFICYSLLCFNEIGTKLIVSWNIFLGLFILIPWLGGYFLINYLYGLDGQLNLTSIDSLLKGAISASLVVLGIVFKKTK